MDPIDILGDLLGGGKGGGSILTDMLGKARKRSSPSTNRPSSPRTGGGSSSRGRSGPARSSGSLEQQAEELEDLLGVAEERQRQRSAPQTQSHAPRQSPPQPDSRSSGRSTGSGGFSFDASDPAVRSKPPSPNEEALVLIRAMISAAKADGRITPDEQQQVMSRLSNASREAVDFMRQEFSRPLDVKELAWSVPLGMEQKVYTLSLAAVHLDEQSEFSYFRDLAHGLRMEPDFCNEIHQRYGVPNIF